MGCIFNFQRLTAKTEREARLEAEQTIQRAAWEHGHGGYTGSFAEAHGIDVDAHTPADAAAAEEWLDENAEKWGPAVLVRDAAGVWYMGANCSY